SPCGGRRNRSPSASTCDRKLRAAHTTVPVTGGSQVNADACSTSPERVRTVPSSSTVTSWTTPSTSTRPHLSMETSSESEQAVAAGHLANPFLVLLRGRHQRQAHRAVDEAHLAQQELHRPGIGFDEQHLVQFQHPEVQVL